MSIKAISGLAPEWFVLTSDSTGETQFLIRPLTGIENLNMIGASGKELLGDYIAMYVKYGVTDWKGIKNDNNNDVPFSTTALYKLPGEVLAELAMRIKNISTLEAPEIKN